jgi:hypothetical protein
MMNSKLQLTSFSQHKRMLWLPVAALLLLLLPPQQQHFAAGQGLSVSPEALSADAELVAQQFALFEGAAELATNLGGRGRGGRGGSSNLGKLAQQVYL